MNISVTFSYGSDIQIPRGGQTVYGRDAARKYIFGPSDFSSLRGSSEFMFARAVFDRLADKVSFRPIDGAMSSPTQTGFSRFLRPVGLAVAIIFASALVSMITVFAMRGYFEPKDDGREAQSIMDLQNDLNAIRVHLNSIQLNVTAQAETGLALLQASQKRMMDLNQTLQNDRGAIRSWTKTAGECVLSSTSVIQKVESPSYSTGLGVLTNSCTKIMLHPSSSMVAYIQINYLNLASNSSCSSNLFEIRDGNDKVLVKSCGEKNLTKKTTRSSFNMATVRFQTSDLERGDGFRISYLWSHYSCGGILANMSGSISMGSYGNNLQCNWVIPNAKGHGIKITWSLMSLEYANCPNCMCDFVQVVSVSGGIEHSFGKYCNSAPEILTSSNTDYIIVYFRSNGVLSGSGFGLKYEIKPSST